MTPHLVPLEAGCPVIHTPLLPGADGPMLHTNTPLQAGVPS